MSLADLAAANGLRRVGARPPFSQYLRETWSRRDFIWTMARFRVASGLERNRLGLLWLVLKPLLNAVVYGVIFGLIQAGNRPPDYPAYVVIGVFLFEFFSSSLNNGAKSITGSRQLVQSLAFPRLTLPLAQVVEGLLSLLPSLALLAILLPILGDGPRWSWLLIVPLLMLYTLFNAGIAMVVARLTVHVQDLTQFLPFVNRILFYTSGVLFDVNKIFESHPIVVTLYDFHPLYQVIRIARSILMGERSVEPMQWLHFGIWSVVMLVLGLIFFWVAEERYGRD